MTGKLGQSLRKYNEAQGQPDFELEKFAINSLLSATHTAEMDNEDQEDIIKKVKEAGKGDNNTPEDSGKDTGNNGSTDDGNNSEFTNTGGENAPPPPPPAPAPSGEGMAESSEIKDDSFLIKPKKLSIFAPDGSEEANYKHKIVEKLHETLNQDDMTEPMVEPQVKPAPAEPKRIETEPIIAPSRKNKPFLPMPNVKPDPKAISESIINEGVWADMMKGVRKGVTPFSLVAIEKTFGVNGVKSNVVGQEINIRIPDIIPAKYEAMKKLYPNAIISVEDGHGLSVWNDKKYKK